VRGGLRHVALERWDCEFEFHSGHGRVSAFSLCLCCLVPAEALRLSDPLRKEPCQMSERFAVSELNSELGNRRKGLIRKAR
jgi:hypothetical protein